MILVSADLELVSTTWKGPAAEHTVAITVVLFYCNSTARCVAQPLM